MKTAFVQTILIVSVGLLAAYTVEGFGAKLFGKLLKLAAVFAVVLNAAPVWGGLLERLLGFIDGASSIWGRR